MSDDEIKKEINKLVKFGLLERRVVNGKPEFKLTQLGKRYIETNILTGEGDEE